MGKAEQEAYEYVLDDEFETATGHHSKPAGARADRSAGISSIFYLHSMLLFMGRALNKTLDFYNSFFDIGPRDKAKIYRNISTHYMKKGLSEKSLEYLQQWSRLEPANADAHYQLAIALSTTGKDKSALKTFDRVLKLSPQHKGALWRKGSLLIKMKDYAGAVAALEALVKLDNSNARVFYMLAIAYDGLDETDKAIAAIEQAIEIDPNEIKYHQHLGFLNVRRDDHQKAAKSFTRVMELERELDDEDDD